MTIRVLKSTAESWTESASLCFWLCSYWNHSYKLFHNLKFFDEILYRWTLITPTKLFSEITCISYAPDWLHHPFWLQLVLAPFRHPFPILKLFLWLRITDEGSVPEMRISCILWMKSDLKLCIQLRSLFLYSFRTLLISTRWELGDHTFVIEWFARINCITFPSQI